jgi:uncharacterized protein
MEKALKRIVAYAVEVARPEKIILFGSVAHKTNNLHSDVDLIVVTSNKYLRRETELRISSFAREHSVKADILIRTPAEIVEARQNPTSFLNSVIEQGEVVYESAESLKK